jgi:flagellar assembly factor FliW
MEIKTKDFGVIEISKDDILEFPDGVYAFKNVKRYVLLNTGSKAGLMQLQSVENEDPRFIIIDPYIFIEDYNPILPDEALKKLKASSAGELSFFVIAVIPRNVKDSTVNLRSPIAVNFKQKLGAQVILDNSDYPVRFRLFDSERVGE